mmetsp:Transcript_32092/g.105903  ORF Transcript_32092/g.105903 Transcript_32092/m.105903 type:complete len:380 (-) Transcript_32092:65-1204(-)
MHLAASLVLLASCQAVAWFALSQPRSPIFALVRWYVGRFPGGRAHVLQRARADGSGSVAARSEEDAMFAHCMEYLILAHHGCGAGIALLSFLLGSPRLFLLGLSFEIGEGVQHALQIAHARAWPARATAPFHSADAMALAPYILLHHSLGLLGGSVAHLYLSDNADVQLLTALLLGAALPYYTTLPLVPLRPSDRIARVELLVQVCAFSFIVWTRFVHFLPLAWRLAPAICEAHGPIAGRIAGTSFCLFTAFNVAALLRGAKSLAASFRAAQSPTTARRRASGPRTSAVRRASHSLELLSGAFVDPLSSLRLSRELARPLTVSHFCARLKLRSGGSCGCLQDALRPSSPPPSPLLSACDARRPSRPEAQMPAAQKAKAS